MTLKLDGKTYTIDEPTKLTPGDLGAKRISLKVALGATDTQDPPAPGHARVTMDIGGPSIYPSFRYDRIDADKNENISILVIGVLAVDPDTKQLKGRRFDLQALPKGCSAYRVACTGGRITGKIECDTPAVTGPAAMPAPAQTTTFDFEVFQPVIGYKP